MSEPAPSKPDAWAPQWDGPVTRDELRRAPKVLLHDHLDGGVRAETLLELADVCGHDLGVDDADALAARFVDPLVCPTPGATLDLERYLEGFAHVTAVTRSPEALERIVREAREDLARDAVTYAELRFAPALHTGSLPLPDVLAVVAEAATRPGTDPATGAPLPTTRVIVTAMRDQDDSLSVATTAARNHLRGIVGFDLAGPEAGHPASVHRRAIEACRAARLPVTVHAGEAVGPAAVADAWALGARRIGHGISVAAGLVDLHGPLSSLGADDVTRAEKLRHRLAISQTPFEVCPSSNVHTGVVRALASHPIHELYASGLAVTVNTDNRFFSATTVSDELYHLVEAFGWGWTEIARTQLTAAESVFDPLARTALYERLAAFYAPVLG